MNQELEGVIQAIEQESKLPSPSHNNLARLIAKALRLMGCDAHEELKTDPKLNSNEPVLSSGTESTTPAASEITIEPETKKKKKRKF